MFILSNHACDWSLLQEKEKKFLLPFSAGVLNDKITHYFHALIKYNGYAILGNKYSMYIVLNKAGIWLPLFASLFISEGHYHVHVKHSWKGLILSY